MNLSGILMMVLIYTLIGFGFACGFALFKWSARKYRRAQSQRKLAKAMASNNIDASKGERLMRRI